MPEHPDHGIDHYNVSTDGDLYVSERTAALFPNFQLGIKSIHADINDDRSVIAAVAGVEGVVNAASLYVETGHQTFRSVHVTAAARGHARAIQTAEPRMYYELGGPRIYTYRALLQMLAQHLGRKPILVPIPFGLWFALAYGAEMLPQPPITRNQVELMQIDSVASPGAAGLRRFADFIDISAGRAPCDRGITPQLTLVL